MNNKDCKHQFWVRFSAFKDEIISVADCIYSLGRALLPPTSTCTASFCKASPWFKPSPLPPCREVLFAGTWDGREQFRAVMK